MMTKNLQNFYITSQEKLDEVIALIKAAKLVALDTEFTRQTTYYPILSIIQVAVKNSKKEQETFIIDCLAKLNLQEFFSVIADPEIKKILHSSLQDLQIFHHKSTTLPKAINDTQIMANFCGFGFNIGYSNIVEKLFSRQLSKQEQRSDWQMRPLSEKQIEYALLDVVFLEEIHEKFSEILSKKNRLNWFEEEMENFVNKTFSKSQEALFRTFTFKQKNPKQITQIKNLILWREQMAQKINVPRQHFIKDEVIEKIVVSGSASKDFSSRLNKERVLEIKNILEQSEELVEKNHKSFMSEKQKKLFKEAKKIITKISAQENFQEQFLLTSSDLKKIICEKDIFDETVAGWRKQVFGEELKELIFNY